MYIISLYMIKYPHVFGPLSIRNVMLLNNVLGFLLGGGAYSHSSETDSQGVVISGWLPLCNNGVRRLADLKAHCFLNIWLEKVTWVGSFSFFIVPGIEVYITSANPHSSHVFLPRRQVGQDGSDQALQGELHRAPKVHIDRKNELEQHGAPQVQEGTGSGLGLELTGGFWVC